MPGLLAPTTTFWAPTGKTNGWKAILNTLYRPLRRPHRRPHPMTTITAAYTKFLTVPNSAAH